MHPIIKPAFFSAKFYLLMFCALVFSNKLVTAQNRANYWVFNRFEIEFNKNNAVVSKNTIDQNPCYGFSSICDSDGKLLLFSNSISVSDKYYNQILNGDSLFYKGENIGPCIIIPKPGNSNIYYIFNISPLGYSLYTKLYYAQVDMSLNNNRGKVIEKRIQLMDSSILKIASVCHKNKNDIWLITHKVNSDAFYSYLISKNGISDPVISRTGRNFRFASSTAFKVSPDGKKLVVGYRSPADDFFDLFDFDSETGEVTNSISFTLFSSHCSGAEFSPDATKLYVHNSSSENTLYQYDLTSNDSNIIKNSGIKVYKAKYNTLNDFQLAPNGKIYFSKGGGQQDGTWYFGVINKPNELDTNCNVIEKDKFLEFGSSSTNMPNFIQSYFYKTDFTIKGYCLNDIAEFSITNLSQIDSVLWSFGDSCISREFNPKHHFNYASEFTIELTVYYSDKTDKITKKIKIYDYPRINLGPDTTVVYGYKLMLPPNLTYLWNNYNKNNYLMPYNSGKYWVRVTNQFSCSSFDTVNLVINPVNEISRIIRSEILVYPNPFSNYLNINTNQEYIKLTIYSLDGKEIINTKFLTKNTKMNLSYLNSGIYCMVVNEGSYLSKRIIIMKK